MQPRKTEETCQTHAHTHPVTHRHLQLEDVPVSTILGTLSALEALCDYALYKSTFTLHLHYTVYIATQLAQYTAISAVSAVSIRRMSINLARL